MVALDWIGRLLDRSRRAELIETRKVEHPHRDAQRLPASPRGRSVYECPHCHTRLTDFDLETG